MKDKILNAYKIYIQGYFNNLKNAETMWYGSEDQAAPNYMHDAIRELLLPIAQENGFEIMTSNHGGEKKLVTEIHSKHIDITIIDPRIVDNGKNEDVVMAISFKMPLSSVNKNLKNFGEANIGDTALIKESGIPFYYIAIMDSYSIKNNGGNFGVEDLSNTSLNVFTDIMHKPRTNKYRSDGLLILKVDFNDRIFKDSVVGRPFTSQNDRKNIGVQHLSYLEQNVNSQTIQIQVMKNDGSWDNNFEDHLDAFVEMIKLELLLKTFRKDYL